MDALNVDRAQRIVLLAPGSHAKRPEPNPRRWGHTLISHGPSHRARPCAVLDIPEPLPDPDVRPDVSDCRRLIAHGRLGRSAAPCGRRQITTRRPPEATLRVKPTNAFALGVVLWLLTGSFASAQSVLHVDAGATGPVHDGSSWCNAYIALQDALTHADASGGTVTEIHVAAGDLRFRKPLPCS